VIHRTFRSLDEAPKLVGFTVKQWAVLIAGSGLLLGVIHLAHVPTKPAITLCTFVIGLPAALTYVSESGGLQLSVLLRAMWRWRLSAHTLAASSAGEPCRARGVLVLAEEQQSQEPFGEGSPVEPLDDVAWERWG
jgi:PrgI family protein